MKLTGYAAVFGTWARISSREEGTFMESVAPGAFTKSASERRDRIRVMLSHGHDPQLGLKPLGPLEELREDAHGLYYAAPLLDGVPELVTSGLRAGLYGSSFRFSTVREEFTSRPGRSEYNVEGIPERVLREVRLVELGPTPLGAYEAATAQVRDVGDGVIEVQGSAGRIEDFTTSARASDRYGSGPTPLTLRRLRAERYSSSKAAELLRELDRGSTVQITWARDGFSSGRVLKRGRTRTRDYLAVTSRREPWRL